MTLLLVNQFLTEEVDRRISRRYYRRPVRYMELQTKMSDWEFRRVFRVERAFARAVVDRVAAHMQPGTMATRIPPHLRVLAALQFYASGSYQAVVGNVALNCMSRPMVCRSIAEVTNVLCNIAHSFVQFPTTEQAMQATAAEFAARHGMPYVLGAIDCTHVAIVKPRINESAYVNRKGFHSINVQLVCDSNNKILAVLADYPGSVHDAFIWRQSELQQHLRMAYNTGNFPYKLIGDSGYPCQPYLLTPLREPTPGTPESRYHEMLVKCRCIIERTIGMLKGKFRCLLKDRTLHYSPQKAIKIIVACCVLHNILLTMDLSPPDLLFDDSDLEQQTGIRDVILRQEGVAERRAYIASHFS